ncbi:hypothetical protein E4U58_005833 [Claviceps cyperi]|nr:hypothetical protein E4U58_005833 [Claviceps cyperi]
MLSFAEEIYNAAFITIAYSAVHTEDLDDLADFLEEALLAHALNKRRRQRTIQPSSKTTPMASDATPTKRT